MDHILVIWYLFFGAVIYPQNQVVWTVAQPYATEELCKENIQKITDALMAEVASKQDGQASGLSVPQCVKAEIHVANDKAGSI